MNRTGWLGLAVGLAIVLPIEVARFRDEIGSEEGWYNWISIFDPDTTWPLFAFLLLPFFALVRRRWKVSPKPLGPGFQKWLGDETKPGPETTRSDRMRAVLLAAVPFLLSLSVSSFVGQLRVEVAGKGPAETIPLKNLPPSLHDEYSYLFQAETFLLGRLANPRSDRLPGLFDQVHVLNDEGVFASRYFPGTGLWMMPFVAVGEPYWGHWLASALAAVFVYFIGRELAGNAVGLLAGSLAAVSPGIQTFAQLLLAHQPTLLGLTFFVWMFLRMMRTRSLASALFAGFGLAFAMLCRPMTSAGVGLPYGVWFAFWWFCGPQKTGGSGVEDWTFRGRSVVVLTLGLPIGLGIAGMMFYDHQITGDPFLTPYQLYTDIYTPRHVYGFNNAQRGAESQSEKVIEKYDNWAENLTPALAHLNVKKRALATAQWTLALVPLAMVLAVFPFLAGKKSATCLSDRRWWLILAAPLSLHLAHVPYWFSGIRDWHYVFESAPFLLLITAGVSVCFLKQWRHEGWLGVMAWWAGFLVLSLAMTYGPLPGDSPPAKVEAALTDDIWARRNYALFNRLLERVTEDRPALVLIADNPADRHMDFVTNRPELNDDILRGRFRPDQTSLAEVLEAFSDRSVYVVALDSLVNARIANGDFPAAEWQELAMESIAGGNAIVYGLQPSPE